MSSISPPSTDELLDFLRAYLGDRIIREWTHGGSHHVLDVEGYESDIAVTMNDNCIPIRTLKNILQCAKIDWGEYRKLAGTPKLLKAFLKLKNRERTKEGFDAEESEEENELPNLAILPDGLPAQLDVEDN